MKAFRSLFAAFLLLAQTACALSPRSETLGPGGYGPLNERTAREAAHLVMRDGRQLSARGLVLREGTATWTDVGTGAPANAPLSEIAEVRLANRSGRATAIGGTWGFLIGAAIGTVLGLATSSDDEGEMETNAAGDALFAGTVTGIAGWLLGMPVGAIRGTDDIYRLPPPPPGAPDRLLQGGGAQP